MNFSRKLLFSLLPIGFLFPSFSYAVEDEIKNTLFFSSLTEDVLISNSIQFSDVFPGDWAYTALQNLNRTIICKENDYTETLNSGQALTRYEVAALINACLDGENLSGLDSDAMRLFNEFGTEMTILKARDNRLEYKIRDFSLP